MLLFDLESNGLLDELTRIHTVHVIDTLTGEALRFNGGFFADGTPAPRDGSIEDAARLLMEAEELGGHNVIAFDIPAITKVFPWFKPRGRVHDTLVYSRYLWPHLGEIDDAAARRWKRPPDFAQRGFRGSHKLEAWGIRLGVFKGEFKGPWDDFTQELERYAAQDVVVTKALWDLVQSRNPSDEAVRLEHEVAAIIHLQERFGFLFNDAEAEKLEIELRGRLAELSDQLRQAFRPWCEPVRKGGKPLVVTPKRDNRAAGYTAGAPFTKIRLVSFNPASRDQIAGRLIKLFGWTPAEFTEGGKPKVDETALGGLDYPECRLLIDYLTVEKRLGQLAEGKQAWRKKVGPDGRIHGRVNTLGAVTRRMTHRDPNMAQIPAVRAPYGARCRALFTVPAGKKLVGCDAEGLELRILAHYMAKFDGGLYVETVVNGKKEDQTDVHSVNQKLIGLNSRDSAKTWIYAYLYGAGGLKLGRIIYEDYTEAQRAAFNAKHPAGGEREKALVRLGVRARKRVEAGLPALGKLQEAVRRLSARKYLKTVDGGQLRVRSAHAALNTLLQGGGAVVVKKALVLLFNQLRADGFVPNLLTGELRRGDEVIGFVANVHDEFQMEVPENLAEDVGRLAAEAIRRAGEALSLRCPLAGAYQVGLCWADSH